MTTVGIIGIAGRYGAFLAGLFQEFGCNVIGSDAKGDVDTDAANHRLIAAADVVIFSIPPRAVHSGDIRRLTPFARKGQLWMDVTSIKVQPIEDMLQTDAEVEVVGLHPMCAPTVQSLRGQTLVVCKARLTTWESWLDEFLRFTGATLKFCTPSEHDRAMAVVQALVHAMQLTMAATIRELGVDVRELLSFTSPLYKIALSLMARILRQDPALYADIQMLNPYVRDILLRAETRLHALRTSVIETDTDLFAKDFLSSRTHFEGQIDEAYALFELLSQLLADHSSEHQAILRVENDRPGLLHEITGVFGEMGINLKHFHSVRHPGGGFRFRIGLDRPAEHETVRSALARIAALGLATV